MRKRGFTSSVSELERVENLSSLTFDRLLREVHESCARIHVLFGEIFCLPDALRIAPIFQRRCYMQEEQIIDIGDIVHLKSGSPDLKVIALSGHDARVEWDGESGLEQAVFPTVCLKSEIARSTRAKEKGN